VKIAEFVRDYFDNETEWDDTLTALQDAVGKGFSALEIHWDASEGQAMPRGFDFVEQKRLLFTDATGYLRRYPLLLTDDEPMGVEVPPWKLLLHRYGGKSGHAAKGGIYRVCAWMYLFKNYALKDWVVFCEVYGMPLRLGKYKPGASEDDKDALLTAIRSLGSDAAGIISEATSIEFVETHQGAAKGELYEALAAFCNRENSKALLGQTLTAEVGDVGSYAAGKVHNEVRMDLARADTRAAAATVRDQLIRPMVGFNFGWDAPIPAYAPVWEEEEDLKAKSDWVEKLLDRGVRMPLSFIYREFGIPEREGDEPMVGGAPEAALSAKAARIIAKSGAGAGFPDDAAQLSREAAEASRGALDALLKPAMGLIKDAKTYEEVGEKLYGLYPRMDNERFQQLLARAMTAAALTGYAAAEEDSTE